MTVKELIKELEGENPSRIVSFGEKTLSGINIKGKDKMEFSFEESQEKLLDRGDLL